MKNKKILIFVQHLLGSGHWHRSYALACFLAQKELEVTLVTGGFPIPYTSQSNLTVKQLPPLKSIDSRFKDFVTTGNKEISDHWRQNRCNQLQDIYDNIQPHIIITEMFPFGRKVNEFELLPLLEKAKKDKNKPIILSSVRDILTSKPIEKSQRSIDLIDQYFDGILVHGDQDFIPFDKSFPLAHKIQSKLYYTGYLVNQAEGLNVPESIVVSVGGSHVGHKILSHLLQNIDRISFQDKAWTIFPGSVDYKSFSFPLPSEKSINLNGNPKQFRDYLRNAELSISQAGYNTAIETLLYKRKALFIPFQADGENEQVLRAKEIEKLGLAHVIDEHDLNPETITQGIKKAISLKTNKTIPFNHNGLEGSYQYLRVL